MGTKAGFAGDRPLAAFLACAVPAIAVIVAATVDDTLRSAMIAAWPLLLRYGSVIVAPALLAWGVARIARSRLHAATTVMAAVVVAFAAFAGVGQLAALALLALSGAVLGSLLCGKRVPDGDAIASVVAGVGLVVGIAGWLLPYPIHRGWVYLALCAVIIAAGHARLRPLVADAADAWGRAVGSSPAAACFAVGVLGFASVLTWLPSLNPDDNALHLLLGRQLLLGGYYRLDVSGQVFAAAPWFNDVLHGILALVSGNEARPAVGLAWLLLGTAAAYRLAALLGAGSAYAWMAAALYASYPLTAFFGTTLQVDGASAACLMLLAAACVRMHRSRGAGAEPGVSPWFVGILCGILAALKVTNCVYLALLGGWIIWHYASTRRLAQLAGLLAIAAVVAGSSYAYATAITGNPLFPLYNSIFKSPYMPAVDFGDPRWHAGFGAGSLISLTFNTASFIEGQAGAAGLGLLAFLGAWAVSLVSGGWRAALVALGFAAGTVVFSQVQYLRYIFPAIALLGTVGVAAMPAGRYRGAGVAILVVLVLMQCALVRTTSWIMAGGVAEQMLLDGPRSLAAIDRYYVPERTLVRELAASGKPYCLLFADPVTPYLALSPGTSLTTAFYDPRMHALAKWASEDAKGGRWREALQRIGITAIDLRQGPASPGLPEAMKALGFEQQGALGEARLYVRANADASKCLSQVIAPRNEARRMGTMP